VLATPALIQRHRGTLKCRACRHPIEEGEAIVRRRVNSRSHWFHERCIYAEAKHAAEARL